VGRSQEDHSGGDRWHDTGGRATLGSLESGIQASNALSVKAGGQVLNTGNLMGSKVDGTGAALVDGYGGRVVLELETTDKAKEELSSLSYTGDVVKASAK